MLVIWAFALIAVVVAWLVPFPSNYDELQHFSVIRAQYEHPSLFADPSRYLVLREDDPTRWSTTKNYINHPSLYYIAMSAYLHVTSGIILGRLINVALAVATLAVIMWAGLARFTTRFGQAAFGVLAASFPKAALIGGMINNDNLAGLAGAMVFAGLMRDSGWMLGIGLALAGWTKLTALIALAAVVAFAQGWRIARREGASGRNAIPIIVGVLIGAAPYLVNLVETGHILYINDAASRARPGEQFSVTLSTFTGYFFRTIALKWGAMEYAVPLWCAVALMAAPFTLAGLGIARDARVARACIPYVFAIAVTLAIHFWFGWRAFERIGDQTTPQTRYYNILWPGIAFAAANGLEILHRASKPVGVAALMLCIAPTIVGGVLLAFVAG